MNGLRKPITLGIIATFTIALGLLGARNSVGLLVVAFLLYLAFGDED